VQGNEKVAMLPSGRNVQKNNAKQITRIGGSKYSQYVQYLQKEQQE